MSNAVGVSTLAFDASGRLVMIAQSENALSSPGGWAPSGSGSLEPVDFPTGRPQHLGSNYLLRDIITTGMNRELVEEGNIAPDRIHWSAVTGYARWLSKGGKPEYFGVTTLNCRTEELSRKPRFIELRWVSYVKLGVHVDFDELTRNPTTPETSLHANKDWDNLVESMTMPLSLALRALGERLRDTGFSRKFLANQR